MVGGRWGQGFGDLISIDITGKGTLSLVATRFAVLDRARYGALLGRITHREAPW